MEIAFNLTINLFCGVYIAKLTEQQIFLNDWH